MHSAVDRGEFYWRRVETLPWSSISTPGPGSLTLSQWYDSQSGLFAVITGIDTPPAPGYVFVREEGFCAPTQSDGLVPLDLWYVRLPTHMCMSVLECVKLTHENGGA